MFGDNKKVGQVLVCVCVCVVYVLMVVVYVWFLCSRWRIRDEHLHPSILPFSHAPSIIPINAQNTKNEFKKLANFDREINRENNYREAKGTHYGICNSTARSAGCLINFIK